MNKSQSITELCKALITFNVKVESIEKDAKNPFFKSSYASLQNIQDAIREPLIESGLTISQHPEGEHGLTTILMHQSGEWIESHYVMTPVKNDPQGIGSCITYQKRYALVSILNLSIGDPDDDGNKATFGNGTPAQPEKTVESKSLYRDANGDYVEKKWLNKDSKELNAVIEKLKAGTTTIYKVQDYFRLSTEMKTLLMSYVPKVEKTKTSSSNGVDYTDSNSRYYRGGD